MRKHHVVATLGILAIVSTFLVPGLAFGQAAQTGTVDISCPTPGAGPAISATPANITFEAKLAPGYGASAIDSLDSSITATATLPDDHVLTISDLRSGATDNCPSTTPGILLTVASTALTNAAAPVGQNTIAASTLKIVTTNRHAMTGVANDVTNAPKYSAADGTGNRHDAVMSFGVSTGLTDASTYVTSLETSRTLLTKHTGTYGDISVGTAIAIVGGIAANQYPGTYTGTITYTLSAQA
jgi:hypothetical protein